MLAFVIIRESFVQISERCNYRLNALQLFEDCTLNTVRVAAISALSSGRDYLNLRLETVNE